MELPLKPNFFVDFMLTQQMQELFIKYQKSIDQHIESSLSLLGPPGPLLEACHYALSSAGKRFRPALVLMIAEAIGLQADAKPAALAIEYFHTASLIADDLPCMDDDALRRNRPALHCVYGEATALLASYALIAAGYQQLAHNTALLRLNPAFLSRDSGRICELAIENTSHNTGLFGAAQGQQIDLYPPDADFQTILEIIKKKTISLFEVAFVLGWLFGGGDITLLPQVKQAAYHFGLAFQVADDLEDIAQDAQHSKQINIALALGSEKAQQLICSEVEAYFTCLQTLQLSTAQLTALGQALLALVKTAPTLVNKTSATNAAP